MSWSGYIPGDLIRTLWKEENLNDQTGTNTSSESPEPFRLEVNAPADRSEPSSFKADELLEQATTVLRRAVEAASKEHAHEAIRGWNPAVRTTPGQEPVSPFTARLTLYCGLLGTLLQELACIAPISPAGDVSNSSKPLESSPSSPQKERFLSRADELEPISDIHDEPPIGSVVMDSADDVWQRDYAGWNCATSVGAYTGYSWSRLTHEWTLRLIYRNDWQH